MIENYQFIEVPERIDLSQELMPNREDDDMFIYGVDPAWLGEVLYSWYYLHTGNKIQSKVELPEYPAVSSYHNTLRQMAALIKLENDPEGEVYTPYCYAEYPEIFPWPNYGESLRSQCFVFDDVPPNVVVGDPLRRTDMSDMFDWMCGVKIISRLLRESEVTQSLTTTHFQEGNGDWHNLSQPDANTVYRWQWRYTEYSDSTQYSGGAWRKDEGSATVETTMAGNHVEMIDEVKLYAHCQWFYQTTEETRKTFDFYVPAESTTFEPDGDDLKITATYSSNYLRDMLNTREKETDYKGDLKQLGTYTYGYNDVCIRVVGLSPFIFVKLKADYTSPENQ